MEAIRDLLLDERVVGLGVVVFRFKTSFHIFGKLEAKWVGPS
jgi:hypothetical protein